MRLTKGLVKGRPKGLMSGIVLSVFFISTAGAVNIKEVARKKLYPGGIDEEPLKVQVQLANPNSGANPDPEESVSSPAGAETNMDTGISVDNSND